VTKLVVVNLKELRSGPIRHQSLSPGLVQRIKRLRSVFKEVSPDSLEKWLEDFRRDLHPDREVWVWERMAKLFVRHTTPTDTLGRKKEVFSLVLCCSASASPKWVRSTIANKWLTKGEVAKVCKEWFARFQAHLTLPVVGLMLEANDRKALRSAGLRPWPSLAPQGKLNIAPWPRGHGAKLTPEDERRAETAVRRRQR
jgi:hypothetical protein